MRISDWSSDVCSSDLAAIECLCDRLRRIIEQNGGWPNLVVAGGVAANSAIRTALEKLAQSHAMGFIAPPMALCTDNAAMIAWAGCARLALGQSDSLDFAARPRWPPAPHALTVPGPGVKAGPFHSLRVIGGSGSETG